MLELFQRMARMKKLQCRLSALIRIPLFKVGPGPKGKNYQLACVLYFMFGIGIRRCIEVIKEVREVPIEVRRGCRVRKKSQMEKNSVSSS